MDGVLVNLTGSKPIYTYICTYIQYSLYENVSNYVLILLRGGWLRRIMCCLTVIYCRNIDAIN